MTRPASEKENIIARQSRLGRWGVVVFLLSIPASLACYLIGYPSFYDSGLPTPAGWFVIIVFVGSGAALILLGARCPECRRPVTTSQWRSGRCPHCSEPLEGDPP